ncbi:MAG: hypothetical protein KGJ57_19800 [Sphingomonadales bacterium]|nr:hypothetical protein [Sphingomonadales bacterium]MDE2171639.1 hypothetical protein [Sphingomonadales bacterium]
MLLLSQRGSDENETEQLMPYHTRSQGVDAQALRRGIIKAISLASAAGMDIIFLIPGLANADGDALVELIGEAEAKAFKKNRVTTINGIRFHMETVLSRRAPGPAVVLAMNVSLAQLERAKADPRTSEWVYIAWADVEWAEYEAANPSSVAI